MAQLQKIQSAINEMEGGAFQILCNRYLQIKFKNKEPIIKSIGSQNGTFKTIKGTPDTVFIVGDNYYFVEYTTTEKNGLLKKVSEDIEKCLDEKKHGVPIDKIKKIIYCSIKKLDLADIESIKKKLKEKGIKFDFICSQNLSYEFINNSDYWWLVKETLGIILTVSSVLSVKEFKKIYDKNKVATPLDIELVGRESEKAELLKKLDSANSIVVKGKSGVGKTRLVLEVCNLYGTKNKTKVLCTKNNLINLDELLSYFEKNKKYIFFIDDANKVTELEKIIELFVALEYDVKIICTVRDYARLEVVATLEKFNKVEEFEIGRLSDSEIKEICRGKYKILNPNYYERIIEIALGNPRIAIMACKVAIESQDITKIIDSTGIINDYFKNIENELSLLHDKDKLKILGYMSYYGFLEFNNSKNNNKLGIEFDKLKEICNSLEKLEIVEIHENKIVKISDQTLEIYFMYKFFVEKKEFNLEKYLGEEFEINEERIINFMNSIFTYYSSDEIIQYFQELIKKNWEKIKNKNDETSKKFIKKFYKLIEIESLVYFQEKIEKLESNKNVEFQEEKYILECLEEFFENREIAMDLALLYYEKRTSLKEEIIESFIRGYGIKKKSVHEKFKLNNLLIKKIKEKSENWSKIEFLELAIKIFSSYLSITQNYVETKKISANFIRFSIPLSEDYFELRKNIWSYIEEILLTNNKKSYLKSILVDYVPDARQKDNFKILFSNDKDIIEKLLEQEMNFSEIEDILFVNRFLKELELNEITYEGNLKKIYENEFLKLMELLFKKENYYEEKEEELEYIKEIESFFLRYSISDYENLFKELKEKKEIIEKEYTRYEEYIIGKNFSIFFRYILGTKNYLEILKLYLESGAIIKFYPCEIIRLLINQLGEKNAYEVLNKYEYDNKDEWLHYYFQEIEEDKITKETLNNLYNYYENYKQNIAGRHLPIKYLKKYSNIKKNVIVDISKVLLRKSREENIKLVIFFNFLLLEEENKFFSFYSENIETLKEIYFNLLEHGNTDYKGNSIDFLIKRNGKIFEEYLEIIDKNKIGFEALWIITKKNKDCSYIEKAVSYFANKYPSFGLKREIVIKKLLEKGNIQINSQDDVIKKIIEKNFSHTELMILLFEGVSYFCNSRKIELIEYLLEKNNSFDLFKKIRLVENCKSGIGSKIPLLEEELEYYSQIKVKINGIKFLKHIEYLEKKILVVKNMIKRVKEEEFKMLGKSY